MPLSDDLPPTPDPLFPFALGDYPLGLLINTWDNTPRRTIASAEAFAATGLTPNLRTGAQSLNNYLGVNSEQYAYDQLTSHTGQFGDASDGDQTEVANRVLDRPYYYNDWTIDSGWVVTTAGWPVFVRGTLLIDGVGSMLEWNGSAAAGSIGGLALASEELIGGAAGGDGAIGAVNPVAGGASVNATAAGAGGDGGNGGGGNPAALGGIATLANADARSLAAVMRHATIRQGVLAALTAGAGGGGGGAGGNPGVDGGGGGAGGGYMLIVARNVEIHNGGALNAIGGAGGPGLDGVGVDGGGGGGGGHGGVIVLIYRQFSDLIGIGGTVSVAGGAPGPGGPSAATAGLDGIVGGNGLILTMAG